MNIEKLRVIDIDLKCVATLKSQRCQESLNFGLRIVNSFAVPLFLTPSPSRTVLPTLQIWKFSLSFANYCITFCHNKQVKGGKKKGGEAGLWHLSKLNAKSKSLLQLQQHFVPFSLSLSLNNNITAFFIVLPLFTILSLPLAALCAFVSVTTNDSCSSSFAVVPSLSANF